MRRRTTRGSREDDKKSTAERRAAVPALSPGWGAANLRGPNRPRTPLTNKVNRGLQRGVRAEDDRAPPVGASRDAAERERRSASV